jgi:hypothetical protein
MSAARSRVKRRGWPFLELVGDGRDGVSVVVIEERMNRRGCRAHHSFWCSRRVFFASFGEDLGHEVHICGDGWQIHPGSERFGNRFVAIPDHHVEPLAAVQSARLGLHERARNQPMT